ncbi:MAG: LuxR C-terminal-related transcriptional regulator [Muribaculaceae bacterium]|nr:LuxR C-terminal-related transcriptional regulator [Muribaculaceae bacterium]
MIDRERGYQPTNTMRELIRDNNMLLHVISRFNIPFGFGDSEIADVCETHGIHLPTFLAVCNIVSGLPFPGGDISLPSLIAYLRRSHRHIIDVTLPHIRHHLMEGVVKSSADKVGLMLLKFFDEYMEEVRQHTEMEERDIFRTAEEGKAPVYSIEHEPMAEKLHELKDVFIYHYKQQDDGILSSALLDIILCEEDLETHFKVENQLLFPLLEKECATVGHEEKEAEDGQDGASETTEDSLPKLGEREKEIVTYIARGLTNKEISEKLFISSHTVATHRRNICAKLDIHSASGLTLYAITHKLIDISELTDR